jgi:acyl dehydratase
MIMTAALRHEISAYNLSAASENKIHDDTIAKKFGFEGGLVPGVEVYAYMSHLPVAHYGPDWLSRGGAEVRLKKPVYDGRIAVASADIGADGGLAIKVESEGVLCATGHADMPAKMATPRYDEIPEAPLPATEDRPPAAPESLVVGQVMGTFKVTYDADESADYLDGARETLGLYAKEKLIHPGLILRMGNRALGQNVRLGPWIHVGSKLRNFAVAHVGDELAARATVKAEYEHKGHRFAELDVIVTANEKTCLTRIHHTAIYQPRQVTQAA